MLQSSFITSTMMPKIVSWISYPSSIENQMWPKKNKIESIQTIVMKVMLVNVKNSRTLFLNKMKDLYWLKMRIQYKESRHYCYLYIQWKQRKMTKLRERGKISYKQSQPSSHVYKLKLLLISCFYPCGKTLSCVNKVFMIRNWFNYL